ncbi:MAG TPA: RecX family transcriptional regulator [Bacteroidetes bacterium]|mgnify:CR=1 FL=1|nr:RecX family transcriptional regulator [Bacteroidota bacterium]
MVKKVYTHSQALAKAQKTCAYQERCQSEMLQKIISWGMSEEESLEVIADLISEGFINEERYAKAFVAGKFKIKHWGRNKIIAELKKKKISSPCIQSGLKEIDEEQYRKVLKKLILKKSEEVKGKNAIEKKHKTIRYLLGRGYEYDSIKEGIESVWEK